MNKLILNIAELVIKMLKKRNLEASEKLHNETHAQYQIHKKIEDVKAKTAELEDKLALAELVLGGVEANSSGKIAKATGKLRENSEKLRDILGGFRR